MTTPKFAMQDTRKPDGFYIQFELVTLHDDTARAPDKMCDGFWPSKDKTSAGYIGEVSDAEFRKQMATAKRRMTNWERGNWEYLGVRARALCFIVRNGIGVHMTLESPGVWGVESDSGDKYIREIFADETGELKLIIESMKSPIYEN